MVDAALAKSELVHFAGILRIDNKYIQVRTEFDGDPMQYTAWPVRSRGHVRQGRDGYPGTCP